MEEKTMELNQWLDKSNSIKKYAHFDRRVSIKTVWNEIKEPRNIITHAFLPFIHSPLIFHKYSKHKGRKDKIRQLYIHRTTIGVSINTIPIYLMNVTI